LRLVWSGAEPPERSLSLRPDAEQKRRARLSWLLSFLRTGSQAEVRAHFRFDRIIATEAASTPRPETVGLGAKRLCEGHELRDELPSSLVGTLAAPATAISALAGGRWPGYDLYSRFSAAMFLRLFRPWRGDGRFGLLVAGDAVVVLGSACGAVVQAELDLALASQLGEVAVGG
jgi:hypothetical protein